MTARELSETFDTAAFKEAQRGGKSSPEPWQLGRSTSASLASEPRMGSPSPNRMKGGDGWTAHAAQSTSRP
jgi:hypothetical protein